MRWSSGTIERNGWVDIGHGISVPANAQPNIVPNHVDGPLLYMRSGELHWLTIWERIQFLFGFVDAYSLERKHRPELVALFEQEATNHVPAHKPE